ncbi:MAG: tetratricopeptide repeat protein, partial [Cyclobacteriaceae bacterium]
MTKIKFFLICLIPLAIKAQKLSQKTENFLFKSDELMYSKVDSSRYYARRALEVARAEKSEYGIASAYQRLGITFQVQGAYDSAEFYSKESLDKWREQSNEDEEARTLNNIGIVYDE